MIGLDDLLRSGFFGVLVVIIAAVGLSWNIIIVTVMIQNRIPFSDKVRTFSMVPFGLSLYFTGIGLGLAAQWYRDFYHHGQNEPGDVAEWLDRIQHCI